MTEYCIVLVVEVLCSHPPFYVSEPGNVSAEEGENVTLTYTVNGSFTNLYFNINGRLFLLRDIIQQIFLAENQFSLFIPNVSISFHMNSYQAVLIYESNKEVISRISYLNIIIG